MRSAGCEPQQTLVASVLAAIAPQPIFGCYDRLMNCLRRGGKTTSSTLSGATGDAEFKAPVSSELCRRTNPKKRTS